jgi:hypothetical protein
MSTLDGLGHAADATDEVDKRTTSRVPPNPWQHAVVAWNLEHNISLNRAAMTSGSFPSPIPARSSHAMPMFFFWLMMFHFEQRLKFRQGRRIATTFAVQRG